MIETIHSDPDFLMHYGVKGMKWGVRNDPKVASQRGRQAFDNFGITNERLNISGKRSEDEGLARRRAVRNKLGSMTRHYDRNKKNINLPQNEAEAKKMGYTKLSKNMSAMHQFVKEDGTDNSKWVSKDGHKEVVFTGAGANQHLTTHAEDEGSYNFFNPTKNPLGHAVVDVVPYVLFGNNPNDRTTMETRIRKSVNSMGSKNVSSINKSNTKVGREFAKNHNISGEAWHSELYHHDRTYEKTFNAVYDRAKKRGGSEKTSRALGDAYAKYSTAYGRGERRVHKNVINALNEVGTNERGLAKTKQMKNRIDEQFAPNSLPAKFAENAVKKKEQRLKKYEMHANYLLERYGNVGYNEIY